VGRLDQLDLSMSLPKSDYKERLDAAQTRLTQLRLALGGKLPGYEGMLGPALAVVFEGWDASGKGGALKRMVEPLDPRHVRVASYAAPTETEKRHHFLGRFWPALPGLGGMTVFDRSWYGRVLVERVEGYATREEWGRAYATIVGFERSFCVESGVLVKFWMHVSEEEQLHRFEKRQNNALKSWKITEDDWRNREKRPQYAEAIEAMLERTEHAHAPWQLVEGDDKRHARVKVIEIVIAEVERGMRERGLSVPLESGLGDYGRRRPA
jgi:polyphosphate kinase 2 (PPK2 family)